MGELTGNLDVDVSHERRIDAPVPIVWEELESVDMWDSPIVRVLLATRGIAGRGPFDLRSITSGGFRLVLRQPPDDDDPSGTIVLGLVAQPWRLRGGIHRGDIEDLQEFDEPGHAVITWAYRVAPAGQGSVVSTRTAVRCTDPTSRRRFLRYWRFVAPFSGIIRRESLRLLERRVEQLRYSG